MMKKKLGALILALVCSTAVLVAQPNDPMPKSFKNFGWSGLFFMDISTAVVDETALDTANSGYRYGNMFSAYTMSWGWRWNLIEFDDHLSLSIETQPMLGLSVGVVDFDYVGLLTFDLPIMVGINSGTAATFRSVDFSGFAWNIGIDIMQSPLIGTSTLLNPGTFVRPNVLLATSLKFRSWKYDNAIEGRGTELEFFAGIGKQYIGNSDSALESPGFLTNRPAHFALIFRKMLNY